MTNLDDLPELFRTLSEDVRLAQDQLKLDSSQFYRRSLVRTAFAYIEGITSITMQYTLGFRKRHPNITFCADADQSVLCGEGNRRATTSYQ